MRTVLGIIVRVDAGDRLNAGRLRARGVEAERQRDEAAISHRRVIAADEALSKRICKVVVG
jgi:hypothetical protein